MLQTTLQHVKLQRVRQPVDDQRREAFERVLVDFRCWYAVVALDDGLPLHAKRAWVHDWVWLLGPHTEQEWFRELAARQHVGKAVPQVIAGFRFEVGMRVAEAFKPRALRKTGLRRRFS